jgi:hypothetical protein
LYESKLWVPGHRRMWEWYSLARVIFHGKCAARLLAPALSHGLARSTAPHSLNFPLFSTSFVILTRHHCTCRVLLAIVYAAGILVGIILVVSYCMTSHCICPSESCTNNVTKLTDLFAASYSPSYSPRLTRDHTCRVLLAIILVASFSPHYSLLASSSLSTS